MKQSLSLSLSLVCLFGTLLQFSPASAQVTPDGTTSTTVNQDGNNFEINDGERAGSNLFHSFQDFSVPTGGEAFFNNAADIANIFSRVTGGNVSNIDGLIRANGSASLFLINPAGIIFGENARLDIGGSFLGSTADSILFPDDIKFSATDTQVQPILTINAPIGLSFRDNPGDIVNRANFGFTEQAFPDENTNSEITRVTNITGLEVNQGENLALIGGNVFIERGGVTALGGNIELGGLSQAGEITINPDGSLDFPEDITKADLSLSNAALVNVASDGGGFININARNLTLAEQSRIFGGIAEGMGNSEAVAGDITINASESVTLIGSGAFENPELDLDTTIRNVVGSAPARLENPDEDVSNAVGSSGSVFINTKLLNITERSAIGVRVYGTGSAKDVNINADTVLINQGAITSQVRPNGRGNSGNVNINTNSLNATNLSFIITNHFGIGEGNAGNININATDSVVIEDESFTALISELGEDALGKAGDINITANSLSINNNVQLLAITRGRGNAGDVNLNITDSLVIGGGADIIAQVVNGAEGNAGNITPQIMPLEELLIFELIAQIHDRLLLPAL